MSSGTQGVVNESSGSGGTHPDLESLTLESVHKAIANQITNLDADLEKVSTRFDNVIADATALARNLEKKTDLLYKKIEKAKTQMTNLLTIRQLKRKFIEVQTNKQSNKKPKKAEKSRKKKKASVVESQNSESLEDEDSSEASDDEEDIEYPPKRQKNAAIESETSHDTDEENDSEESDNEEMDRQSLPQNASGGQRKAQVLNAVKRVLAKRNANGDLAHPEGVKASDISAELGVRINLVTGVLKKFVDENVLTRTGGKSPAKPFRYKSV